MARKPRLSVPGALHHVMSRGIDGCMIFGTDEDREKILSLLAEGITLSGSKCYAWVLMDNHYHLLLRTNEKPLSHLMRGLNSKYARWFRKKNQ
jgi:putative transposase